MRILIVEDEAAIRTGLASLIQNHTPYRVVGQARDGREGLAMIKSLQPDLVITDIRMPEMDGLQMLEELQRMRVRQHAVILSGYSDFSYAQQALRFGADDYLLKPLAAGDVSGLLERMERKIEEENSTWLEGMSGVLRQVVLQEEGAVELARELREILFGGTRTCVVFMGRVGTAGVVDRKEFSRRLRPLSSGSDSLQSFPFYYGSTREVGCLLAGENTEEELVERFAACVLEPPLADAWSAAPARCPRDLGGMAALLRERLLYGMVLGGGQILTRQVVEGFSPQELTYPQQIAGALRRGICNRDREEVAAHGQAFMDAMRAGRYPPVQVRRSYEKLCMLILGTVQEFDAPLHEKLEGRDLLGRLSAACTFGELEGVLKELLSLLGGREKREDIRNYVIMKALNYIRENYRQGITLDEIAQHLSITPEYLSALFNREMGVNFSTFIRRFRINHAKRMLTGTDQKVYEIAEQVGYADVKYFNRVFKEEEGVSPTEYRALH